MMPTWCKWVLGIIGAIFALKALVIATGLAWLGIAATCDAITNRKKRGALRAA